MGRVTKILLVLAVITFPAGLLFFFGVINVDAIPELHVLFPFGVIALGMFFISRALDKQLAPNDVEQRAERSAPNLQRRKEGVANSPTREEFSAAAR